MIHKNWKKRFRSFLKMKEFHIPVGLMMIGVTAIATWMTHDFVNSFSITCFLFGVSALLTFVPTIFFAKTSDLDDEEVSKEEMPKEKVSPEKNEIIREENPEQLWENWMIGKQRLPYITNDQDIHDEILTLFDTISHVMKISSPFFEERKYWMNTCLDEIGQLLIRYEKLTGMHKERMKPNIVTFLKEKRETLKDTYITPYQERIEQECMEIIEHSRQTQKEHIYLTD